MGLYLGTRADNLGEAMGVVGTELARLREEPATAEELARAKENLKGRVVLALESTGARMHRLGSEVLAAAPLLSLDEVMERIEAVSIEDLGALVGELWAPERLSAAGIGPEEQHFEQALAAIEPALLAEARCDQRRGGRGRRAGWGRPFAGRSRARRTCGSPGARIRRSAAQWPTCWPTADVLVDFTIPDTAVQNAREALAAGVHVVIGTTGFDVDSLRGLTGANIFIAPNFAIGAVLMTQFAAEAARHMARAEIIELHHDRKLDKPSGTAARTARLMREAAGSDYEVPIHSVRLPGLVAHQEVILGDVGQTLTIRHDSIDRASFMPGVLLAVRRVAELTESPLVGLEQLL